MFLNCARRYLIGMLCQNFRNYFSNIAVKDVCMRKRLENLVVQPTYFAPILQVKEDGNFKYTRVKGYNSPWLKHNKEGVLKKPDDYESLCPFDLWMEDRWGFIRRMVGDVFC